MFDYICEFFKVSKWIENAIIWKREGRSQKKKLFETTVGNEEKNIHTKHPGKPITFSVKKTEEF